MERGSAHRAFWGIYSTLSMQGVLVLRFVICKVLKAFECILGGKPLWFVLNRESERKPLICEGSLILRGASR